MLLHAGREAGVLVLLHPNLTLDRLIERDLSLGLLNIRDLLDGVQKDLHKVVMVKAEDLDEKIVLSGYKVTLHNFGNLFERLNHLRIFVRFRERYAHKSTHIKSEGLRFYEKT